MSAGGIVMNVNTNAMVSMTEANQNFSRVARLVDEQGAAIIMKNNRPVPPFLPKSSKS